MRHAVRQNPPLRITTTLLAFGAAVLASPATVAAAAPAGAPEPTNAAARSVAGVWNSKLGTVTLQQAAPSGSGPAAVTGFHDESRNRRAELRDGTFDPATGALVFTYFQPWRNVTGTGRFVLSPDGNRLTGTYTQPGASGPWTLERASPAAGIAGAAAPPTAGGGGSTNRPGFEAGIALIGALLGTTTQTPSAAASAPPAAGTTASSPPTALPSTPTPPPSPKSPATVFAVIPGAQVSQASPTQPTPPPTVPLPGGGTLQLPFGLLDGGSAPSAGSPSTAVPAIAAPATAPAEGNVPTTAPPALRPIAGASSSAPPPMANPAATATAPASGREVPAEPTTADRPHFKLVKVELPPEVEQAWQRATGIYEGEGTDAGITERGSDGSSIRTLRWHVPRLIVPGAPSRVALNYSVADSVVISGAELKASFVTVPEASYQGGAASKSGWEVGGSYPLVNAFVQSKYNGRPDRPSDAFDLVLPDPELAPLKDGKRQLILRIRNPFRESPEQSPWRDEELSFAREKGYRGLELVLRIDWALGEHAPLVAVYRYRWTGAVVADAGDSALELQSDPDGKTELRADGRDRVFLKSRVKPRAATDTANAAQAQGKVTVYLEHGLQAGKIFAETELGTILKNPAVTEIQVFVKEGGQWVAKNWFAPK